MRAASSKAASSRSLSISPSQIFSEIVRSNRAKFWLTTLTSEVVFTETFSLDNGEPCHISDHYGLLTSFGVIQCREAIELSPDYRPSRVEGVRSESDLTGEGLRLTPENHLAWQAWAVEALYRAESKYNRHSLKAIPAARIVIAGDVAEPVIIPLTTMQKQAIKADLLRSR